MGVGNSHRGFDGPFWDGIGERGKAVGTWLVDIGDIGHAGRCRGYRNRTVGTYTLYTLPSDRMDGMGGQGTTDMCVHYAESLFLECMMRI